MSDDKAPKPLPGNHGQFGPDKATEGYERLKDAPTPPPQPDDAGVSGGRVER